MSRTMKVLVGMDSTLTKSFMLEVTYLVSNKILLKCFMCVLFKANKILSWKTSETNSVAISYLSFLWFNTLKS